MISGPADSVSFGEVWDCLPDPVAGPLSFLHPAALLLFSDRLFYFKKDLPSFGPVLFAESLDGIRFLPVPPRFLFSFFKGGEDNRSRLKRFMEEVSCLPGCSGKGFSLRIDNCTMGVSSDGFSVRNRSDTEYVLGRQSLLDPSGKSGRSLRWERNRFEKDHPSARVRPLKKEDRSSAIRLVESFLQKKFNRSEDSFERAMAEDMGSAFDRAFRFGSEWELHAWVLEEKGRILGIQWYGLSLDRKTLVCFLEAREGEFSNVGTAMTRQVLFSMESVLWVNIQGGGGLSSIERSKKNRPHLFEIPLFSFSTL